MVGTVRFYLLYLIGKPVLDGVQGDIFLKEAIPFDEAKPRVYSVSPPASLQQCKVCTCQKKLWWL